MSDTQDQLVAAVKQLEAIQKKHLNQMMAQEALLVALIERIDPAALEDLADEYQAALVEVAEQISPSFQMPQVWAYWQDKIEARRTRAALLEGNSG